MLLWVLLLRWKLPGQLGYSRKELYQERSTLLATQISRKELSGAWWVQLSYALQQGTSHSRQL